MIGFVHVSGEQVGDNPATSPLLTGKAGVVDYVEPDHLFQQTAGETALIGYVKICVVSIQRRVGVGLRIARPQL